MNKWKLYAIIMTLVSLGSLRETFRILTSNAPDIVENRASVLPIAVILSAVFVSLAIWLWKKYATLH